MNYSHSSHWQPSHSIHFYEDPSFQERGTPPDSSTPSSPFPSLLGKHHRSNKPKIHHLDPLLQPSSSFHGLSKCLSSSTEALPPIPQLEENEWTPLAKAAEKEINYMTKQVEWATRKPVFFPQTSSSEFTQQSPDSPSHSQLLDTHSPLISPKRTGWWDNSMSREDEKEMVKSLLRQCIIETDGHSMNDPFHHSNVSDSAPTDRIVYEPCPPTQPSSKDSTPRTSHSKRHSIHRLLAARNFNHSDELSQSDESGSCMDMSTHFNSQPTTPSTSRPNSDSARFRKHRTSVRVEQPITLKYCLDHRLFQQAMDNVSAKQSIILLQLAPDKHRNIVSQGFDDLLYVLSKYWFLYEIQQNPQQAKHVLETVIKPRKERETTQIDDSFTKKDQEHRLFWFKQDYRMLCEVAQASDTQKPNVYASLDLNMEMNSFWESAHEYHRLKQQEAKLPAYSLHPSPASKSLKKALKRLPLYAQVVYDYFIKPSDDSDAQPDIPPSSLKSTPPCTESPSSHLPTTELPSLPRNPLPAPTERLSSTYSSRARKITPRTAGSKPGKSVSLSNNLLGTAVSKSEFDELSIGPGYIPAAEVEKHMPPPCSEGETADFGLNAMCGPVLNHIKALDVTVDNARMMAATAGGETRSDKRISIWDVRSGSLLKQLDNTTHKAVLTLSFHPQDPDVLLSSDMEFDVKLWNWRTGELMQCWKKMHTRIIYKCLFIPFGDVWRIATCSADHSIKLWNSRDKQPHVSSMHANEPFTSFVLCGSASNDISSQILVASLSYTLRVYKTRTLTLLHTIQMKDLKTNKTPITTICSHPLYDNYILLSCDNQIRLFDLSSEMTLRTFSARELAPGMRIEGQFSPCGIFVYCATWDCRSFSFHPSSSFTSLATGIYIWNIYSAKLEKTDMRALQDAVEQYKPMETVSSDAPGPLPITCCKWIQKKDNDRKYKALVMVGLDKTIRMYL